MRRVQSAHAVRRTVVHFTCTQEAPMGRGILLWFLGIPIPIIILIMLFVR